LLKGHITRVAVVQLIFTEACSGRTRGNGFNLKECRLKLDVRKKFFTMRVVRPWNMWPEKLWMPHHWKCSGSGWMGLWAIWSSWRCSCSFQGFGL